ncbi:MAG TPA: cytochrome c oxidase subunit II [Acidimicrobiales bacterium]
MGPQGAPDQSRRRRETLIIAVVAALLAVGGAAIGALVLGRAGLPRRATEQGAEIVTLWRWLLGIAGAIAGVVLAFLFSALALAWRDRREPEPEQVAGNVRLELLYTAIPLVIVGWVFVLSLAASDAVDDPVPDDALHVTVTGFQWGWRFDYGDGVTVIGAAPESPELVLPVDRSIAFELQSSDVIHSFFSPAFLTKLDVIPGRMNELVVTTAREGVFDGHCAEFCGLDHARMNFVVRVVSQDEFDAWLSEARAEGARAGGDDGGNGG